MNSQGEQRKDACRPVVAAWNISGHDAPVFVDDTGRRAHGVHLAGVTIAMLCACWLATLVFGISGLTSLPGTGAGALPSAPLISTQDGSSISSRCWAGSSGGPTIRWARARAG